MTMRRLSFGSGLVLSVAVIGAILVTPAAAKKKPPPPPPPPPPSTSSLYVKSYADVIGGVKCDLTAEGVQAASDGGSVALALASCAGGSWVAKFDAFGNPQWQEMVECFNVADGGYFYGVSLERTAEGGYVIGGGTRDCDLSPICPYTTSQACGLIVKLDASGNLAWSRIYASSAAETTFWDVKQAGDGGFVAVGAYRDANGGTGALILKVDGGGTVQWQTLLRPLERTYAYLDGVQPTADGGYVAAGTFYPLSASGTGAGVLAVKVDGNGNVRWQRGFNSFDGSGMPTAGESVGGVIQTFDGGYLIAGSWSGDATVHGDFRQGPLLLKLDANGNSQWQKAYSAGLHCFFGIIGRQCAAIGGLGYSVQQTSDGGYAFAGAGHVKFSDSVPLVPALTKTDASGNLLWQHFYYEVYPSTGRTLSQYFASSALTGDGGHLAVGFTENPRDFAGEVFAVRTDSAGGVGGCGQIHPASPVTVVDPGLATIDPAFPVQMTAPQQADLPARTRLRSIATTTGGGC
jgi:hypothetical protein